VEYETFGLYKGRRGSSTLLLESIVLAILESSVVKHDLREEGFLDPVQINPHNEKETCDQ